MITLYFGTIQGQWDLMLKQDRWKPVLLPLVKKLVQAITPLLLGKDEWLDNRLRAVGESDGVVHFTNEKTTAMHYAATFPEVVVTCLNRFVENLRDGGITDLAQAKQVAAVFKELHAFFTKEGSPLLVTAEFAEQDVVWFGLNEYSLTQALSISSTVKSIEPVSEEHLFLYYYKDFVKACAEKGITL